MKMTVLCVIAPRKLVEVDRRFRDVYCLHLQGDDCARRSTVYTAQYPRILPPYNT
jgi:hypothetical protein